MDCCPHSDYTRQMLAFAIKVTTVQLSTIVNCNNVYLSAVRPLLIIVKYALQLEAAPYLTRFVLEFAKPASLKSWASLPLKVNL
jgi:hypothetical protein